MENEGYQTYISTHWTVLLIACYLFIYLSFGLLYSTQFFNLCLYLISLCVFVTDGSQ